VDSEVELWDEILRQHGLGEDRGHNPKWLRYGARYFDHDHSITYDSAEKRPDKRTALNYERARRLRSLMSTGFSQNQAAKQLGIPKQTASDMLRKHVNPTCPESSTSNEGNK
jgi:hypothetical protein